MENAHREYIKEKENMDKAVLFIHGILGSPDQFRDLVKITEKRYSVFNLLLPGHGATGRDFAKSSMKIWQEYVDEKLKYIVDNYSKVVIVGHSMGCLLAVWSICSNVEKKEKIKGIFLLAPPFCIRPKLQSAVSSIKIAFGKYDKGDERLTAMKEAYSVGKTKIFEYFLWLPRYGELLAKAGKVRKITGKLELPALAVFSEKDELVGIKGEKYINGNQNFDKLILKKSGHSYYTENEKRIITEKYIKFVEMAFEK